MADSCGFRYENKPTTGMFLVPVSNFSCENIIFVNQGVGKTPCLTNQKVGRSSRSGRTIVPRANKIHSRFATAWNLLALALHLNVELNRVFANMTRCQIAIVVTIERET